MDSGGRRLVTVGVAGSSWDPITTGDLASEILSRLPTRSVARFRRVCRRWLSITTEPSFIKSHTLLHPHPPPAGIILKPISSSPLQSHSLPGFPSPGLPDPFLSFLSDHISAHGLGVNQIRIKSTSNGLILFDNPLIPTYVGYIVCNPITKKFRCIPHPPITRIKESIKAIALFFDPSSPSHSRLHYSLVCISSPLLRPTPLSPPVESQFWVYSSLAQSWRASIKTTDLPFNHVRLKKNSASVTCGGSVHWGDILYGMLVSFEVESEQLRLTPFPPVMAHRRLVRFGEYRGRLHLMETYRRDADLLWIFELELGDGSEWQLLYRVRLDAFLAVNPVACDVNFAIADPLCIVWEEVEDGGRDSEALLLLRLEGELTSYNLHSKVHRKVGDLLCDDFDCIGRGFRQFEIATYAHTLFSP